MGGGVIGVIKGTGRHKGGGGALRRVWEVGGEEGGAGGADRDNEVVLVPKLRRRRGRGRRWSTGDASDGGGSRVVGWGSWVGGLFGGWGVGLFLGGWVGASVGE